MLVSGEKRYRVSGIRKSECGMRKKGKEMKRKV
jgi:hypothetical protein